LQFPLVDQTKAKKDPAANQIKTIAATAILENATATAVLIVAGVTIDAPEADLEKLSVDYRYRSRNGTAFAWHP
jgi:hypothetical protein